MNVTNTAGDVVRTPTLTPLGQPEEWQPGETRDLPEALARALAVSAHFTLTEETAVQAQPTPVEAAPLGQPAPAPEPTPAPEQPQPFAPFGEPTTPTL